MTGVRVRMLAVEFIWRRRSLKSYAVGSGWCASCSPWHLKLEGVLHQPERLAVNHTSDGVNRKHARHGPASLRRFLYCFERPYDYIIFLELGKYVCKSIFKLRNSPNGKSYYLGPTWRSLLFCFNFTLKEWLYMFAGCNHRGLLGPAWPKPVIVKMLGKRSFDNCRMRVLRLLIEEIWMREKCAVEQNSGNFWTQLTSAWKRNGKWTMAIRWSKEFGSQSLQATCTINSSEHWHVIKTEAVLKICRGFCGVLLKSVNTTVTGIISDTTSNDLLLLSTHCCNRWGTDYSGGTCDDTVTTL
jgi:hypothetical protein